MSKMKNVKLVLLGVLVATIGLVSCEREDLGFGNQSQKQTTSFKRNKHQQVASTEEYSQREGQVDSLAVNITNDHGTKGDGKLGDD